MADFPAFINHDLRVQDVTPEAVELLFNETQELCHFEGQNGNGGRQIGFQYCNVTGMGPVDPYDGKYFYNLRQVNQGRLHLGSVAMSEMMDVLNSGGRDKLFPEQSICRVRIDSDGKQLTFTPVLAT